tara:strand:- start:13 stop:1164 length:1152 start_codon:yes stop_codon:yes gene_type:complete
MPHGGYHGVVKMGGVTVQQGSSSDGQGGQTGGGVYNPGGYANDFDTGQAGDASDIIDKGLSPTNSKDAAIINALNAQEEPPVIKNEEITGLPSGGILQALYGGGAGSIEGYDPENTQYNLEGQHPLSQQFVRLADKYYGGDQKAFAQSSQGQVLLNYLQDVPYTKGGLLGLPTQELEEKLAGLGFNKEKLLGLDLDYEQFKTKNIPVEQIRNQPDLNRLGPLSSEDYKKFNEFLYASRPDLYAKARPFSSGKLPASIIKFLANPTSTFAKGIANSLLNLAGKDPLKEKEPFKGLATDNQFIDQLNYEGFGDRVFPLDSNLSALIQPLDTNQGGMNDVAQAVINQNVTPVIDPALDPLITAQLLEENLPEGGINTFDPDSFAFT